MKRIFLLALFCGAPGVVFAAQEEVQEVTVTATRIEAPVNEVSSSVTIITANDIEKKQQYSVAEVLRGLPSIDVVNSGGPGRTTSVFIRGAKSEHTLVLIDGIEAGDAMSTGRSFDFSTLQADNIERIEIIRGPQGTLYGSDAIGGVINIITKKGKGSPGGFVSAEAGSFNTFEARAGLSGGTPAFNYSLGISRLDTDGFSVANEKDGNTEDDGYANTTLSARLGGRPVEDLDIDLTLRYIDADTDLDACGGAGCDDLDYTSNSKQFLGGVHARLSLLDDAWVQRLGLALTDQERRYSDGSFFDGSIVKADWQHDLYLHKTNTLTLGAEAEKEKGRKNDLDEKSVRTTGLFIQDQIKVNDFYAVLGARVDDHSKFGSVTTYRAGLAYDIKGAGLRLKANYGTGFKAPSLYQLYAPAFTFFGTTYPVGNENLTPEESVGWDIGVEKMFWGDRASIEAVYFRNEFENLINYDFSLGYINILEAESHGFEVAAAVRPYDALSVKANYTRTETRDKSTGLELARRPRDKFGMDLNHRFLERGDANLGIIYVGKRLSSASASSELAPYTLVNLAASYGVTDTVSVFGRIDNVFDEDYEEVDGYGTAGRSVFAGAKVSF